MFIRKSIFLSQFPPIFSEHNNVFSYESFIMATVTLLLDVTYKLFSNPQSSITSVSSPQFLPFLCFSNILLQLLHPAIIGVLVPPSPGNRHRFANNTEKKMFILDISRTVEVLNVV